MQKESISFIILAAGMGSRMKSKTPKVLHLVAGKPIIFYILQKILCFSNRITIKKIIIVLGHESELVKEKIYSHFPKVSFAIQDKLFYLLKVLRLMHRNLDTFHLFHIQ